MKKILIFNIFFTFIGIIYCRSSIDLTNGAIESLYGILIFISPLTLFASIVLFQFKGGFKKSLIIIGLFLLVMYTWWSLFLGNKNYEDIKVLSSDPLNRQRKIIRQYLDEGAIGGHSRTVKVLEILPGLRYIESIEE